MSPPCVVRAAYQPCCALRVLGQADTLKAVRQGQCMEGAARICVGWFRNRLLVPGVLPAGRRGTVASLTHPGLLHRLR